MELEEVRWQQEAQRVEEETPAPARKRGEPREGAKRRNSAEVAEDAAADLADQQAAEAAQQQTGTTASLTECPCEHPVSRFDGDVEICEACGEVLSETGAVEQIQQETVQQVAQTAPAAKQHGGQEPDLF